VLFVAAGAVGGGVAIATFLSLDDGSLPPVSALDDLPFPAQSVVYARDGDTVLARFGDFQRTKVEWKDIPPVLVDATTAVEDRTFWENPGFDPIAIAAAALDTFRGNGRGASTITQQLVRQRLLEPELVQDSGRTAERKLKEIIQSIKLTQAFPGDTGKQQVMTAYLNQNYYGNDSYGVAAAARTYFGKDLKDLTLAQAAIIAAIPQAPSTYDLVRNAEEHCTELEANGEDCKAGKTQLVVPDDSKIVQRRNLVLDLMSQGRTPLTAGEFTAADFASAKDEPVVLAKQAQTQWRAPHFVWQVRDELTRRMCGEDAQTCTKIEEGGFKVVTTLDWTIQRRAEAWVKAATIIPKMDPVAGKALARSLDVPYSAWMTNLKNKKLGNGALVAEDYQTGELIAYVGSADYYGKPTPRMQPQFDVANKGYRQPGSAFKPIMYSIGIDDKRFAAGSMFMDVVTDFGGGYTPTDADRLERGPVRLRDALRFSLNIPAVKAVTVAGPERVFARSQEFGLRYASEKLDAGAAVALGVEEVHPVDLVGAYGTLANGGVRVPQTTILEVTDTNGKQVLKRYDPAKTGQKVLSPQAAYVITDVLAGNTVPATNPFWGKFELTAAGGKHRPATLKTGTNNDAKDLNAYGYIAPPTQEGRGKGEFALAVGVWNGNSDNSLVSTAAAPLFSIDVSTFVWQGFLDKVTDKWAVNDFRRPDGLVEKTVDPFTGVLALPGGRKTTELYLADGPQPVSVGADSSCGEAILRSASFEGDHESWLKADRDWIARARRGPGAIGGPERTRSSYFYNGAFTPYGRSWGPIANGPGCASPSPSVSIDPCASGALPTTDAAGSIIPTLDPSAAAVLCPSASPSESPSVSPSESAVPSDTPSPEPTATPTAPPTPEPTPTPTPTPAPTPTPTPTPTDSPSPAGGGGGGGGGQPPPS
jgi:membrane peptidoglycan carboxypeptidase